MTYPLFQIDAFSQSPFTGNPAAVCVLTEAADTPWMQHVAAEMNLSETAFFYPLENGHYHLRWFTPTTEVPLCGHATLATAHTLWVELKHDRNKPIIFDTLSGELTIRYMDNRITMDFPSQRPEPVETQNGLLHALNITSGNIYQSSENYLIEMDNMDAVMRISPNFLALEKLASHLVIVTAQGKNHDFISRVFVPGGGINEDPVTGSAHCLLAPFWSERLGKSQLTAKQISQRGGELNVEVKGESVFITGQAITVLRGELDA